MSKKLKPRQKRAALYLAQGDSGKQISIWLGLRTETLSRWKKIPEFSQLIDKFMADEEIAVRHRITHLANASVSALWSELHDKSHGTKRVNAALKLLTMVSKRNILAPHRADNAPNEPII